jgi:TonB family protein
VAASEKLRLIAGMVAVLLCTCLLCARESDEIYTVGNGVTSPRVIRQVSPEHPSRGFRIQGTVLIGLIVTAKGEPEEVHVVRSLDKEVDQSAMDAVRQWRFEPGTKDGKPVAVRINVEIRFHDM